MDELAKQELYVPDIEKAKRLIASSSTWGLVLGVGGLAFALLSELGVNLGGLQLRLQSWGTALSLLTIALSLGIKLKKSRACATILCVIYVGSILFYSLPILYLAIEGQIQINMGILFFVLPLTLGFAIAFYNGFKATFVYHKIVNSTKVKAST